MDFKKTKAPLTTVTRDMNSLCESTGNIYETVKIIGKRANQISVMVREEIDQKLQEFTTVADNLEEVFENREQIEMSRSFEKLSKPTLIATQEFIENKLFYKLPAKEKLAK
jgi:DNA-directed RNA polymerase subunit K/omega